MAPTPRGKKAAPAAAAVANKEKDGASGSSAGPKKGNVNEDPCAICGAKKLCEWIQRDASYTKLMKFIWINGFHLDVKIPTETANLNFCKKCYLNSIELYDTNEVMVNLEKHLRQIQKTLVKNSCNGLNKLQAIAPLELTIHKKLFERWGNGFKSEDEDEEADGSAVVKSEEESDDDEDENSDEEEEEEEDEEEEEQDEVPPPPKRGGGGVRGGASSNSKRPKAKSSPRRQGPSNKKPKMNDKDGDEDEEDNDNKPKPPPRPTRHPRTGGPKPKYTEDDDEEEEEDDGGSSEDDD